MFINDIPESARTRPVLLSLDDRLIDAAKLLVGGTDIVVVCDDDGIVQGVITKTDLVRQISVCQGSACQCPAAAVMTRSPQLCRGSDLLQDVSLTMKARDIKTIVLVDESNRPLGLLTARAILRVLLGDALHEEEQLIGYVSGVGYR